MFGGPAVVLVHHNSISRILTLRYDPLKKPIRKRVIPADFKPLNYDDVKGTVTSIIEESIARRHRDLRFKKISLSLSGGVDSRLTLAMIRSFLPEVKVNCIGVGFGDEGDEVGIASEVARIHNCDFEEIILDSVLTELPKLIHIVREPRWNLYHYYTFQHGKKNSKVFYTGDGGDELFGGYTFRYSKFLSLVQENTAWEEKAKAYLLCHERDWVPDQPKMFGPAIKFSWDRIYRLFRPYFGRNGLSPIDQVFLSDFNGKLLYDWMPSNKAFACDLDLKIESVFLTDRMIKFATHLPWQEKYDPDKAIGKIPLRSILAQYNVGKSVNTAKKGFSVDLAFLWNKSAREIVSKYVNCDSQVVKNRLISGTWIEKTFKMISENEKPDFRYVNKMLSILALEIWYNLFVTRSMKRHQKL